MVVVALKSASKIALLLFRDYIIFLEPHRLAAISQNSDSAGYGSKPTGLTCPLSPARVDIFHVLIPCCALCFVVQLHHCLLLCVKQLAQPKQMLGYCCLQRYGNKGGKEGKWSAAQNMDSSVQPLRLSVPAKGNFLSFNHFMDSDCETSIVLKKKN